MGHESWHEKIFNAIITNTVAGIILTGLTILASQFFTFFKIISSELATIISFSVLSLSFIIYGLSRGYVARQKRIGKKLNPYIWINDWRTEFVILKQENNKVFAYRTDTIKLSPLRKGEYQYKIRVSKQYKEVVYLLDNVKNAKTYSDLGDPEWIDYIIDFSPAPKVRETREITLSWRVENLESLISQTFANCAGFSRWRLEVSCPDGFIAEGTLFKVRNHTMIGAVIDKEPVSAKRDNNGIKIIWEIENSSNTAAEENIWYRLEWKWRWEQLTNDLLDIQ